MKFGAIGVVGLLLLTGCSGLEDHSPRTLVSNDSSKGKLTWIDSETGTNGWLLTCPNPSDYFLYEDTTASEITSSEEALNFCDAQAATLTVPEPFGIEQAEGEINTFITAVPKYKNCLSDFGYRMGTYAVDNAEFLAEMGDLMKASGDYIGGSLTQGSSIQIRNAGYYLQLSYEEATGSLANLCGEIQF
jgi:hypothetical protein